MTVCNSGGMIFESHFFGRVQAGLVGAWLGDLPLLL